MPTLRDFERYGRVTPIALLLGITVFTSGIRGNFSCANVRLVWGTLLIIFGFLWFYASSLVEDTNPYQMEPPCYRPHWPSIGGFAVFATFGVLAVLCLLKRHAI